MSLKLVSVNISIICILLTASMGIISGSSNTNDLNQGEENINFSLFFDGGDGSSMNPFQISNITQLQISIYSGL